MSETVFTRFKIRRDTNAAWNSANPVLLDGELGLNTTNNQLKIGNGSTAWNSLPYVFQPLDSDLTAIAALTTTSFGRALLEAVNAAALRSAADLGSGVSGTYSNPTSITVANGIITAIS